MKRGPEYSDSSRKKLVGELLRNADKLLKSGEYDQALAEVEKSLELEPGNFYAQAYKERITALREKHTKPGDRPAPPPASAPAGAGTGLAGVPPEPSRPAQPAGPSQASPPGELTEATGARIEEVSGIEGGEEDGPAVRDVAGLKEQLGRERASHEDEARRQTEDLARQGLEDEIRQHEEADRLRAAEQQAMQEALAGAPAAALAEVVKRSSDDFERLLASGDFDGAFRGLAVIGIVDPGNEGLAAMTARLDAAIVAALPAGAAEGRPVPREIPLQWYARLLRAAWSEGTPSGAQSAAISEARKRFKVTPDEEKSLVAATRKEIVVDALKEAYRDGEPDAETRGHLEKMARELSVGDLDALRATISS